MTTSPATHSCGDRYDLRALRRRGQRRTLCLPGVEAVAVDLVSGGISTRHPDCRHPADP